LVHTIIWPNQIFPIIRILVRLHKTLRDQWLIA
jgi:hypothetical protein